MLGRLWAAGFAVPRGPRAGLGLRYELGLERDLLGAIYSHRAAQLSVVPKRTRTLFSPDFPRSAERLPKMVPEDPTYELVRQTLVARSRYFKSAGRTPDQVGLQQVARA